MKREHNAVLQDKERRIRELEGQATANASPLAALESKIREAETHLQARKQQEDMQTITVSSNSMHHVDERSTDHSAASVTNGG